MDPDGGNHEPNRKGCHSELGSAESGTQTPGPRYKRLGREAPAYSVEETMQRG
jgi:hypothetical protein